MDIILSNVPQIIFKTLLKTRSVKTWVYFGQKEDILEKLDKIFAGRIKPINYAHELFDVSQQKRSDFIRWVDAISSLGAVKKEWLFSVPATKNTYSSHLFLYICYFFVLQDLVRQKKIPDVVIVDSPALGLLLKKYFPHDTNFLALNYFFIFIKWLTTAFWSFLLLIKYSIDFMLAFWVAKIIFKTRAQTLLSLKPNLVILRNFITEEFTDTSNDIFIRHYFPGLDDYLKSHGYTPVYLPIIMKTKNYKDLFSKVRASKRTIVFAEEFLKISDYLAPIKAVGQGMFLKINTPAFNSFDFRSLVAEEYFSNLTDHGSLLAHLLSRLGKRFSELKIKPLWIINWNENQALEKGFICGFKEAFADIKVIGSQPFFSPPNHLSLMPSKQDKLLDLVPDKILVLGPAGEESVKEFVGDLSVDFSPAFRYVNILGHTHSKAKGNNLLVLLGYGFHNALHMMKILLEADKRLKLLGKVFVKVHPVGNYDRKRLCKACPMPIPDHFEFVEGRLEEYLDQVNMGICGATGTAIELILSKIPVIIIGDTHSLTMNYLSYKKDPQMWRLCFSADEVVGVLKSFKQTILTQPDAIKEKANEFRQVFFAKPDERHWRNYILN